MCAHERARICARTHPHTQPLTPHPLSISLWKVNSDTNYFINATQRIEQILNAHVPGQLINLLARRILVR